MPSAGHSSMPTARTVSYSAASSPGWPHAAIQLAESLTSRELAIGAASRLVIASATAMRPDAGASISASGVRSPIAIASPAIAVEVRQRHGAVGHRHLPRADHLVARAQAADRAVADGDQEALVGDRRVAAARDTRRRCSVDAGRGRAAAARARTRCTSRVHLRRLAEQHVHRHVDRLRCSSCGSSTTQLALLGRHADDGERAALALADRREQRAAISGAIAST